MREVPLTVYTIFRAAHRNLKLVTRRQKREDSQVNQNLEWDKKTNSTKIELFMFNKMDYDWKGWA